VRQPINCVRHGEQRRAFVCVHLVETAEDGKPRGFVWKRDAEGEYEAFCTPCSQISAERWAKIYEQQGTAICLQCFAGIGRMNGVVWPSDAAQQ
jgi:hypothetical protein